MSGQLELILTGFGIVIGVLAMLWGVTAAVGLVFRGSNNNVIPATAKPTPLHSTPDAASRATAPAATASVEGAPAHHLVVIAAAVSAILGGRAHRVVNVSPSRQQMPVWAQQGLFEHFASHRANLASWDSGNGN